MIFFIGKHPESVGFADRPSSHHERVTQRRDLGRRPARPQRDESIKPEVMQVLAENFGVYGVRKVWRQTQREGFDIARRSVAQ